MWTRILQTSRSFLTPPVLRETSKAIVLTVKKMERRLRTLTIPWKGHIRGLCFPHTVGIHNKVFEHVDNPEASSVSPASSQNLSSERPWNTQPECTRYTADCRKCLTWSKMIVYAGSLTVVKQYVWFLCWNVLSAKTSAWDFWFVGPGRLRKFNEA